MTVLLDTSTPPERDRGDAIRDTVAHTFAHVEINFATDSPVDIPSFAATMRAKERPWAEVLRYPVPRKRARAPHLGTLAHIGELAGRWRNEGTSRRTRIPMPLP